ncbi:5-methyltetrahydropteroyltriglutamate--homocysteine S-methyltransferase [Blattabacterium cuenoti]|uniref:5-methyltetrahydropteroyltriglutamate-- homocysteine S-methyltransferase n=1 Tax=Blattabacterium cuenoti TaxID=1653831 RepID=UPI00163C7C34|nr:5-methyltetrahydropteroyltriglutamate--homocysteine S-methyltransferase [Blattabacterium cuenoti]
MLKHNLGYPRIGIKRELKKACEDYWNNLITSKSLFNIGKQIRINNWKTQENCGLDLIPCNDFSFYDHVLDMSFLLGNISELYYTQFKEDIDIYFAMARGFQKNKFDFKAMEMTKWFNTNYHYIVPEFEKNQKFGIYSMKIFNEIDEYKKIIKNAIPKPVLIGPLTYLYLGKEKNTNFNKLDLIDNLLPVYIEIIQRLIKKNIKWIQLDEPILVFDSLNDQIIEALKYVYKTINKICSNNAINIILTSYFDSIEENNLYIFKNFSSTFNLHIDLVENNSNLTKILDFFKEEKMGLSLGIINGKNIWKNNYTHSIKIIEKAILKLGKERIIIAPSCSLLHIPIDLEFEDSIPINIINKMAFAKQKLYELNDLEKILNGQKEILLNNFKYFEKKEKEKYIFKQIKKENITRTNAFQIRQTKQQKKFRLPLFPTTTIGSFPQTKEIRTLRKKLKNHEISQHQYEELIQQYIIDAIKKQEKINLDVLVHGEFERNDMVEFFSDKLQGFVSTKNGWVQSYGSRCVKPPVIYEDVKRVDDMTVKWISFAQSQTKKLIKGILTGPVTILKWSFVRDDQPYYDTAYQIAWAIREEVKSLENSGIKIIQIDEPALREGLPLKKKNWKFYFDWAIKAFKLSSSIVKDETQIHTHICYSEVNDILKYISDLDADVITIETSRSKMELLNAFSNFAYQNEIGPGVYDIHSPRIPGVKEILNLINKASKKLPIKNLWINPDCGLKTRTWNEVMNSLKNMTTATKIAREQHASS